MKKCILFLFLFFPNTSEAQHNLSVYGGWTASKILTFTDPNFQKGAAYDQLYAFPVLHAGYFGFEYEYDWKFLRFSTGGSYMVMGTSEFFFDSTPWETWYINLPLIVGAKWDLPKNFGLTLETGIEVGFQIGTSMMVGSGTNWGNINGVLGLEANWNQFRFGTRVHIGLTEFRVIGPYNETSLHHSALTTYIGYTIWDSKRAKELKAKRLAKKQAQGG